MKERKKFWNTRYSCAWPWCSSLSTLVFKLKVGASHQVHRGGVTPDRKNKSTAQDSNQARGIAVMRANYTTTEALKKMSKKRSRRKRWNKKNQLEKQGLAREEKKERL